MLMYWQLLCRSIERGQKTFDFGRSSQESNTFRFKKQWGAEGQPAVWQYYVRKGDISEMRPESKKYRLLHQNVATPTGSTHTMDRPSHRARYSLKINGPTPSFMQNFISNIPRSTMGIAAFTAVMLTAAMINASALSQAVASVIEVKDGDDLNAALQRAELGDQIVLQAGARFRGPFILPYKSVPAGNGRVPWITIRTSDLSGLPPVGPRVGPEHAVHMPTIYTRNSYPAITAELRAHHYHFVGIEITTDFKKVYDLVRFGFNALKGRRACNISRSTSGKDCI